MLSPDLTVHALLQFGSDNNASLDMSCIAPFLRDCEMIFPDRFTIIAPGRQNHQMSSGISFSDHYVSKVAILRSRPGNRQDEEVENPIGLYHEPRACA